MRRVLLEFPYFLPMLLLSGELKEEEIYPTLSNGLNGALASGRVKIHLKNSMYPLMYLFGKNSMSDVDYLLTSFYQLDDEAGKEVVETIKFKLLFNAYLTVSDLLLDIFP